MQSEHYLPCLLLPLIVKYYMHNIHPYILQIGEENARPLPRLGFGVLGRGSMDTGVCAIQTTLPTLHPRLSRVLGGLDGEGSKLSHTPETHGSSL